MKQEDRKQIAILGAGLAGLRLGSRLSESGFHVKVYEKENYVGGLLRTVEKDGLVFDLGPHLLFQEYLEYYQKMFREELLTVEALFGIGFKRKQIRSPVNPLDLMRTLSPTDSVPLALGMTSRLLFGSDLTNPESADEWVSAKFGKRANEYFFKYYIEKSTGWPSRSVSAHWCTERHRFYREHNLWQRSLKMASRLFKRSTNSRLVVYYPRRGAQAIAEAMADIIEKNGGSVVLNSSVTGIRIEDGSVKYVCIENREGQKQEVIADLFVNTLPITYLWDMLTENESITRDRSPLEIRFRNLWLFYFFIKRPRLSDKVQTYFPEERYIFKRIYEPKNLDPRMGTEDVTGICVEVGYTEGDETSKMSEKELAERIVGEIADFYSIEPKEVVDYFSLKVPFSYPIYKQGYEKEVQRVADLLFDLGNLFSIGRQGLFRYDFMTNRVMESADSLAECILSGKSKKEFLGRTSAKSLFF